MNLAYDRRTCKPGVTDYKAVLVFFWISLPGLETPETQGAHGATLYHADSNQNIVGYDMILVQFMLSGNVQLIYFSWK